MRIAVLDDYQDCVRRLDCFARLDGHETTVFTDTPPDLDALVERLAGFDAIVPIRERTRLTRALLERLSGLRLISLTGPASGQVDLAACRERGIVVCAGRGSGTSAPEHTWALVLAATRHVALEDRRMREGRWQSTVGRVLAGKTLGILGYGRIGAIVAGYAKAFGMRVVCWGREGSITRARTDGHEIARDKTALFEQSDVLSIHLSLNDGTRGTVTAADLARMKNDALLVNTARAALIEPDALVAALKRGRPGSAAVDVYEDEPVLGASHPLLSMDNVVCAPHLGYVTREGYEAMFGDAFANIAAWANGQPSNVIEPAAG
jgi:D-3-phosphoglycerate dehydrogenase / 2-oxoglutarate reductase